MTTSQRQAATAAIGVLAALIVLGLLLPGSAILEPLLVVAPLVAAIAAPWPVVALIGAAALLAALPMGLSDHGLGTDHHLVSLALIALGAVTAAVIARSRSRLLGIRHAETLAYRRIALLDRSSRLIAAPMDFRARLKELSLLVVPDVADLAMIDLATPDGHLDGVVASASDSEISDIVEQTRARFPIREDSDHPVAVALRTGEPQLRRRMTDDELARYASSPEHLALMRRLRYSSAIVVPLVARAHVLGVLSVLRLGNPVEFSDSDMSIMSDLAGRAALAVDNARLFEERLAAEAQLQTILADLAEAITMVNLDGELVYVNGAAARLFGYGSAEEAVRVPVSEMFADYELLAEDGRPFDPDLLPGRRVLAGEESGTVTIKRRHLESGEERWLRIKASAVPDAVSGEPALAVNVIEDVTEERRGQATAGFLSEASKLLASSLDFEETLQAVAQAAVPEISDWCAVDLVDETGEITSVALAHVEPAKAPIAAELRARYPQDPSAATGTPQVARSGEAELYPEIEPALLEESAQDERHLELMRALEMTSVLIVPMIAGNRTIGTITFVTTGGRRRLGLADRALAEELGRRAGVAVQNARVHRERSLIASTLQRSLLPPNLPRIPGIALAARFRAAGEANQVGGDFYDLFPVQGGWMIVIGDVTGKGPDAAAITSLARYTIRTAAVYEPKPAAVMRRLNDALLAEGEQQQMCTAACLLVTPSTEGGPISVEMVCAGHPSPYLLRSPDVVGGLCRPGPLLGAFAQAVWTPDRAELHPGDGVVLYTDGVTDARGHDGRFGHARLERVLIDAVALEADAVAAALDIALADFQHGPQRDDVALLVLRATTASNAPETPVIAGSSTVPG